MCTLVLNASAELLSTIPVSIISWKEAIKLWSSDAADVLASYEDWPCRSPSITIGVPSVIMVRKYVKPQTAVKYSRYNVYLRDEFVCQYCNKQYDKDFLTLDHVIPRYHGGRTTWSNVVTCCVDCNRDKAHFLDMRPVHKPRRPDYGEMLTKRRKFPVVAYHPSWIDYLGWDKDLIIERYSEAKSRSN